MMILYQFQFSHFCEKARWGLDYKGVPYQCRNLFPGLHIKVAKQVAAKSSLPILIDNETVVQDSTAILTYLDEKVASPSLLPRLDHDVRQVLEWEEFLDQNLGVSVRCWYYYYLLPDRQRLQSVFLLDMPWYYRPVFAVSYSALKARMSNRMRVSTESAEQSRNSMLEVLDRLDDALAQRNFLVADQFTRADLTACALLSPICMPGRTEDHVATAMPEPIQKFRTEQADRRCLQWAKAIYDEFRRGVAPY